MWDRLEEVGQKHLQVGRNSLKSLPRPAPWQRRGSWRQKGSPFLCLARQCRSGTVLLKSPSSQLAKEKCRPVWLPHHQPAKVAESRVSLHTRLEWCSVTSGRSVVELSPQVQGARPAWRGLPVSIPCQPRGGAAVSERQVSG